MKKWVVTHADSHAPPVEYLSNLWCHTLTDYGAVFTRHNGRESVLYPYFQILAVRTSVVDQ
jgi:hypothetical protein